MAESRQHVVRAPSFTGFGYFPERTPSHHADFDMGTIFNTASNRMRRSNDPWKLSVFFMIVFLS
jgi:hypothetical protein